MHSYFFMSLHIVAAGGEVVFILTKLLTIMRGLSVYKKISLNLISKTYWPLMRKYRNTSTLSQLNMLEITLFLLLLQLDNFYSNKKSLLSDKSNKRAFQSL